MTAFTLAVEELMFHPAYGRFLYGVCTDCKPAALGTAEGSDQPRASAVPTPRSTRARRGARGRGRGRR